MENTVPKEIYCTLTGMVDVQLVNRVFNFFSTAINGGVKKVHLLIHSTGGFISDGIVLYNYLSNLPIELITYNSGGVSSIAVLMFLSAKKRIASETATFMIHKSHVSATDATATMLKAMADSLDIDNNRTEAILKKHVTLPESMWILHQQGDITLTAQKAMEFTLIHEIKEFIPSEGAQIFNI